MNKLILLGDFNLLEIDWSNNSVQDNFLSEPKPIRESNILDLVLTTLPDLIDHLPVVEPFADHKFVTSLLSGTPYIQRKSQKLLHCYGKAALVSPRISKKNHFFVYSFLGYC